MSELRQALVRARAGFWGVALFTGVVNILMLMGPLFMLQVYDRVLASSSTPPPRRALRHRGVPVRADGHSGPCARARAGGG